MESVWNAVIRGVPSAMPSTGAASASSSTELPTMVGHRCRITQRDRRSQVRLTGGRSLRRGHTSRGPIDASRAGSSVTEVATLSSGMSSPPSPMLRRNGNGTKTSAASDTATVTPLNTTDRPAVAIAVRTAASLSAPFARSSRQRMTISSE